MPRGRTELFEILAKEVTRIGAYTDGKHIRVRNYLEKGGNTVMGNKLEEDKTRGRSHLERKTVVLQGNEFQRR